MGRDERGATAHVVLNISTKRAVASVGKKKPPLGKPSIQQSKKSGASGKGAAQKISPPPSRLAKSVGTGKRGAQAKPRGIKSAEEVKPDIPSTPKGTGEGKTFVDLMEPSEAARYKRYREQDYKDVFKGEPNTRQRQYTTPGTGSIIDQKINGKTGELYERETIFDQFGRRIGNNDYTDHGRPDVLTHTNPHHHANPWYNPTQHGPGTPGLHPSTPRR